MEGSFWRCRNGSYLWLWHCEQPMVDPSHTVAVVFTRSTITSKCASSLSTPPSSFNIVLRLKPVAIFWASVAFGSMSPAICSMVN